MIVKRYYAEDMRQALRAVREELGPDAVILSNERLADGVEILASADYDEAMYSNMLGKRSGQSAPETGPGDTPDHKVSVSGTPQANAGDRELVRSDGGDGHAIAIKLKSTAAAGTAQQPADPQPRAAGEPAAKLTPPVIAAPTVKPRPGGGDVDSTFAHLMESYQRPVPAVAVGDEDLMQAMRSEIDNLRLLLKDQLRQSSTERWKFRNPLEAAVAQRFTRRGLSRQLSKKLATRVTGSATIEDAWIKALAELEGDFPVLGQDLINAGGVVALMGPTGAGKTTTIAKLAIRYAMEYGRENLALVTTDSYRVAAYDQLRTLARIIDVPVRRTDDNNSLRKVLRGFRDKSLVLIDMAGFNAGDARRRQQLASLHEVDAAVTRLLVLPCTSQEKVLRAAYELVAGEGLAGCILSKVDEAQSMGEVLSLVLENNLPVTYITNGQAIPDDIEVAQAELLLSYLLYADVESAVHDRIPIRESLRATPVSAASRVGMI